MPCAFFVHFVFKIESGVISLSGRDLDFIQKGASLGEIANGLQERHQGKFQTREQALDHVMKRTEILIN